MDIVAQTTLIEDALAKAITYDEYRLLVHKLVEEGKATGPDQSENLVHFSKMNDKRMKRLDKTLTIEPYVSEKLGGITKKIIWLVITEGWCGDASQILPVLQKLIQSNSNFEMKVVLRDEHEDLMNNFLTNGGKAIPKVLFIDAETHKVLKEWGPRPSEATKMVLDYKKQHKKLTPEFKQELQQWYNSNKGKNISEDIVDLLSDDFTFS